jgi:hypothetical protein
VHVNRRDSPGLLARASVYDVVCLDFPIANDCFVASAIPHVCAAVSSAEHVCGIDEASTTEVEIAARL